MKASSVINAIGTRGSNLVVEFKSGHTYEYAGAAHLAAPMKSAASIGKYFHANVKPAFTGVRV